MTSDLLEEAYERLPTVGSHMAAYRRGLEPGGYRVQGVSYAQHLAEIAAEPVDYAGVCAPLPSVEPVEASWARVLRRHLERSGPSVSTAGGVTVIEETSGGVRIRIEVDGSAADRRVSFEDRLGLKSVLRDRFRPMVEIAFRSAVSAFDETGDR